LRIPVCGDVKSVKVGYGLGFLQRKVMLHIIYNPTAGKKLATKNLVVVERLLKERGVAYEVHATTEAQDGERIARELTTNGETELVVFGGDGTLHEVLNGVVDPTACKLGLIPSGTGNDFATCIGLPMDVEKATKILLEGEAKDTDYIEMADRRCMNVGGIGMDVDVLERCLRGKMRGKLKYFASLLKSFFTFKGCSVTVVIDGKEEKHNAILVDVCNGVMYGGGIPICPKADVADGKISALVVDCIGGKMALLKALLTLMKCKISEYPETS
jgi:YegS/Rv2252/BmrU family lipid kinase